MTTDEFAGNVKVTISDNEVRVWVCDEKGCQFRFKAIGQVVRSNGLDVMVIAKEIEPEPPKASLSEQFERGPY